MLNPDLRSKGNLTVGSALFRIESKKASMAEMARQLDITSSRMSGLFKKHKSLRDDHAAHQGLENGSLGCGLFHASTGLKRILKGESELDPEVIAALAHPTLGFLAALTGEEEILDSLTSVESLVAGQHSILSEKLRLSLMEYRDASERTRELIDCLANVGPMTPSDLRNSVAIHDAHVEILARFGVVKISDGLVSLNWSGTPEMESKIPGFIAPGISVTYLQDPEQVGFYKCFVQALRMGIKLKLEGNIDYCVLALHEIAKESGVDSKDFARALAVVASYEDEPELVQLANRCFADRELLRGNFVEGFRQHLNAGMPISLYITLASVFRDERITVNSVAGWCNADLGLSDFGYTNLRKVESQVQSDLDSFHEVNGVSLVLDLWEAYRTIPNDRLLPERFDRDFGSHLSARDFYFILQSRDTISEQEYLAYEGLGSFAEEISYPDRWYDAIWILPLLRARLRSIYRDAENRVRELAGLPRIGEGWISETALYKSIKSAFPDEQVVHQGRPRWLAPQSLDIFFPRRLIGVEYQGIQHSQPVERFGGEEAFVIQQERDMRKKVKCKENGCALIEVFPGYDLEEVLMSIRSFLV